MHSNSDYTCFPNTFFTKLEFFTLKIEAAWPSEMLVSYHITIWRNSSEDRGVNFLREFSCISLICSSVFEDRNVLIRS